MSDTPETPRGERRKRTFEFTGRYRTTTRITALDASGKRQTIKAGTELAEADLDKGDVKSLHKAGALERIERTSTE